ncbi:MAG: hypothetical protein ACLRQF_18720 [Thomasclavelia ramosa]
MCRNQTSVYLSFSDNGDYSIEYSSSPLRKITIINHENPVVIKLMNNDI